MAEPAERPPSGAVPGPEPSAPGVRERFPDLVQEFRRIAAALLRKLPAPSLVADDLVAEAYLKMLREESRRVHARRSGLGTKPDSVLKACFGAACRDVMAMRWRKRGRRRETGLATETPGGDAAAQFDLADVHDLLAVLAAHRPETAQIVEARVFGGLTVPECAELFGVSPATVDRRWALARAWIRQQLRAGAAPETG
ncbi:MAG: ECF-type sigma factor [Planctomycetota bacterium]